MPSTRATPSLEPPVQAYQMFIDGKFVNAKSGKTFNVFDPATEGVIATCPAGEAGDVAAAVAAAAEETTKSRRVIDMARCSVNPATVLPLRAGPINLPAAAAWPAATIGDAPPRGRVSAPRAAAARRSCCLRRRPSRRGGDRLQSEV